MAAVIINNVVLAALIAGGMDWLVFIRHFPFAKCRGPTRNQFVAEGFFCLTDFRDWSSHALDKVATTMQKCLAPQRVQIGIMALKNLKALAF